MTVTEITLHRLKLPLETPYHVSYRVYEDFEPIVVEAHDDAGRAGWGEGHISPGYSDETVDGGWAFCRVMAERMIGETPQRAREIAEAGIAQSPVAASALVCAMEMLEGNRHLQITEPVDLALLTPFHATDPGDIEAEVEARIAEGFATLKVKVGKDVDADLARVALVQRAAAGRAVIRLDANRGFSRADGTRFAAALDPHGIELFEQPCASADWDANAAVAAVSTVPVMLDESIYGLEDIERAADIEGIGFIKLKLKKLGGLDRLDAGLRLIRTCGMEPVLGDGVSADICCWMEACVARSTITNAGEFNGFLKPTARLFSTPLRFGRGVLHLAAGFTPEIDRDALIAHTIAREPFVASSMNNREPGP